MSKRVYWASRHQMTPAQLSDLERGLCDKAEIIQCSKTVTNIPEFVQSVINSGAEVLCVVLPVHTIGKVLECLPKEIPLLVAKNGRKLVERPGEEPQVEFIHLGWIRYKEVRIVSEPW